MKLKKKTVILLILAIFMTAGLIGCALSEGKSMETLEIKEIKNHLAEWEDELQFDVKYEALESGAVRGLKIQKDGETTFAVSYEPREEKESYDYWDISVPYQSLVSVNTEELYHLFDTVLQIGWSKAPGINVEDTGITHSRTSITIMYDKEQRLGEKGKAEPTGMREILIGNKDGKGNYYAALKERDEVILIKQDQVDAILNADPYQYILKLPVLISMDTVKKIQIISGKETHVMVPAKANWKLDGRNVEQKEFQELYGELIGVMLSGKKEGSGDEERTPALTLQFIRNVEGASDVEVTYYELDDKSMSVSVNGMEYFFVDKQSIDALKIKIKDSFQ